jgi:hypothetical protein
MSYPKGVDMKSHADHERLDWRKARASGAGGCVEVAADFSGTLVRDTTNRQGPVLRFRAEHWRVFVKGLKEGDMIGA